MKLNLAIGFFSDQCNLFFDIMSIYFYILTVFIILSNGTLLVQYFFSSGKKSNHQRYKTSVAFADFLIGAFVLPLVLVQRYYAAKLQPPFWFDDLGLNDDLIERKKVSFLSNYPELTQAVGVILFTSLFASNFSLLFSTFDMFVGIKFPFKRIQNETYIKWSGRLGVLSAWLISFGLASTPLIKFESDVTTQFKKGYITDPFTMMVNCEWNNGGEKNFRNDIWNMLQLIIYTISLVLMILMNLYTIQILRESINVLRVDIASTRQTRVRKKRLLRSSMILVIMVIGFIFAWLPGIFYTAFKFKYADELKDLQWGNGEWEFWIRKTHNILGFIYGFSLYSNSAVNPIIFITIRYLLKVKETRRKTAMSSLQDPSAQTSTTVTGDTIVS